jgi:signal peptidase I
MGYWAALGCCGAALVTGAINPLAGGILAVLFLGVAVEIRRQRAWAAIAGVCFLLAPIPMLAIRVSSSQTPGFAVVGVVELALSFFLAQTAIELWHAPENRGPLPWAPLAALFVLVWMVFEPSAISGGSMENTILRGDQVLVETATWRLGRTPDLGEIVLVPSPGDHRQRFVKRVVAGPGDRLRIQDKKLYRNGDAVDEPYAVYAGSAGNAFGDNFPSRSPIQLASAAEDMLRYHVRDGEVVVPEGKYFVLGDNRDDSLDSRHWGFVSGNDILGSPMIVYASYDANRRTALGNSVRNIRWSRIGRLLR